MKAKKDRAQAAELLDFFVAERPAEIPAAVKRLRAYYPSAVRFVRQGAQRLAEGPSRELVLRLTERQ